MSIGSIRHKGRLIVLLSGDIDMATAPGMLAAIDQLLVAQVPCRLVVSIKEVPFMDSAGLALLAELIRIGHKSGFGVALVGVSECHRRLLDVTRMSDRFTHGLR